MLAKYSPRPLSILIAVSLLTGCSSVSTNGDLDKFNRHISNGDFPSAATYASQIAKYDNKTRQIDDVFWGLQAGAALNKSEQFIESNQILDSVEQGMRSQDTQNWASSSLESSAAIAVNDKIMKYQTTHYDGVMLNTIKAWNFISQGDIANARVEFNRAYERERRAVNYFNSEISEQNKIIKQNDVVEKYTKKAVQSQSMKYALKDAGILLNRWQPYQGYTNPFVSYSQALFYLLNGKDRSDYKRAVDNLERVYGMTGAQTVADDLSLAKQLVKNPSLRVSDQVWVIFENGQSVIKEEKRLDLPLFLVSDGISYVSAALPRLKTRGTAYDSIKVAQHSTELLSDMDRVIAAEFDKHFPVILTREVVRLLVKSSSQKLLSLENDWLEGAGGLYTAATTGADTRSFSALPSQYQVLRFNKSGDQVPIVVGNKTVSVALNNQFDRHIIWVSVPTKHAEPLISVINL
ncbi:hypothetical protein QTV44_000037 [Vibrio vulnificus]|nr:hypothetical protein [Vibrio vulnificus]